MSTKLTLQTLPREIIIHIGKCLEKSDYMNCLRLCKTWNQLLLPRVWKRITSQQHILYQTFSGPSGANLRRHAALVQKLGIHHNFLARYTANYPNLRSLTLLQSSVPARKGPEYDPIPLIANCPSLVELKIACIKWYPPVLFWKTVSGLPQLALLEIREVTITDKQDIEAFWSACLKVQTLNLISVKIPFSVNDKQFTRMKSLEIAGPAGSGSNPLEELQLIRQCPNLEELNWKLSDGTKALRIFAYGLAQGLWKELNKLTFGHKFQDEELGLLLSGMRRIFKLGMESTGFGPNCFQVVRNHFHTVTLLELKGCPEVSSAMLQEVMCSAPLLEKIYGDYINAKDILEGKPWACLSLKTFKICILFHKSEYHLHPAMFDRLATLKKLEELAVGEAEDRTAIKTHQTLDLRVVSGLEKLKQLRHLKYLDGVFSRQPVDKSDVDWIEKNLPVREVYLWCLTPTYKIY
ncbi:hypothetical protein BGX27_009878 [Mortierella sp. AM989]|nr:hypothetical protein BGX27_009878 [Mortierella sp. AM989]